MNRLQKSVILVAAIAIPAAAHSTFAPTKDTLCFASGATTYQIARNAPAPDFRIKIADASASPDLRMQLVDSAEMADFVLVDRDPTKVDAQSLAKTQVLETWMAGKRVFSASPSPPVR